MYKFGVGRARPLHVANSRARRRRTEARFVSGWHSCGTFTRTGSRRMVAAWAGIWSATVAYTVRPTRTASWTLAGRTGWANRMTTRTRGLPAFWTLARMSRRTATTAPAIAGPGSCTRTGRRPRRPPKLLPIQRDSGGAMRVHVCLLADSGVAMFFPSLRCQWAWTHRSGGRGRRARARLP